MLQMLVITDQPSDIVESNLHGLRQVDPEQSPQNR